MFGLYLILVNYFYILVHFKHSFVHIQLNKITEKSCIVDLAECFWWLGLGMEWGERTVLPAHFPQENAGPQLQEPHSGGQHDCECPESLNDKNLQFSIHEYSTIYNRYKNLVLQDIVPATDLTNMHA